MNVGRRVLILWLGVGLSACMSHPVDSAPVRATPVAVEGSVLADQENSPELSTSTGEIVAGAQNISNAVADAAFEGGRPLVARVNDAPIFLDAYEQQVAQMAQALQAQAVDPTTAAGQAALNQAKQQVLNALIEQLIIEQQAETLGISISEEMLEARVQESIAQGQGQAQFETWLAANSLTLTEFERLLRSELIANQLFEHVTGGVPDRAEQIRVRHIQVADEALARQIIEQLKGGADFAGLAQDLSVDDNSRTNGGDLGWLARGMAPLPPEVERIAFSLQPGQVSGPIGPKVGFHIIKLEEKEADRPLTNEMLQAVKKQLFTEWLAQQRAASQIERYIGQ